MNIIAKTNEGFLIQATNDEVKSILIAVLGTVDMTTVNIGTKIPAIDYASTIRKVKSLKNDGYFKSVITNVDYFNKSLQILKETLDSVPEDLS